MAIWKQYKYKTLGGNFMKTIILGGGFGGLNAAVRLAKQLDLKNNPNHEVVLISDKDFFLFKPSLIWSAFGQRDIDQITFPLAPSLDKVHVQFIHSKVKSMDLSTQTIRLANRNTLSYDYLIIATGAASDWDKLPGKTTDIASIFNDDEARTTYQKINKLQNGHKVVVGVTNENPLPSIAYEFVFELDEYIKKHQLNVEISFFTSEQNFMENAGGKVTDIVAKHMEQKQIKYYCNKKIAKLKKNELELDDGQKLSFDWSFILPPYKGSEYIFKSEGISHQNGLIEVNDYLQLKGYENVFAVGDIVIVNNKSLKNGRLAELQGEYAANTIVKQIHGEDYKEEKFQGNLMALWELGTDGAVMAFKHPMNEEKSYLEFALEGAVPHLMKTLFEKYYIWRFS